MSGINIKLREYWLSAIVSAKSTVKAVAPPNYHAELSSSRTLFNVLPIQKDNIRLSCVDIIGAKL